MDDLTSLTREASEQLDRLDQRLLADYERLLDLNAALDVMRHRHSLDAEITEVCQHLDVLAACTSSLMKRLSATQHRLKAVCYAGAAVIEGVHRVRE